MKISETSFEQICKELGDTKFCMHTKAEDVQRSITSSIVFQNARKELMDGFGDVEISLHPDAPWFDKVQIEDEKWQKAYDDFSNAKQAWCDKYGCD